MLPFWIIAFVKKCTNEVLLGKGKPEVFAFQTLHDTLPWMCKCGIQHMDLDQAQQNVSAHI